VDAKTLREDLKKLIDKLPPEELEALWERYEDYMIEIELDKDPNFFKYAEEARKGINVIPHEEIEKELKTPSFDVTTHHYTPFR